MSPDAGPAPIIVSARFASADQAWFDALRTRHFPPERNHLSAHLTLFHHLPPSLRSELDGRLAAFARGPAPRARIAGLINLGRGVAIRIDSAELAEMRGDLAEAFAPLLTPQDRGGWRPHVTIQNKVPPEQARALMGELGGAFGERSVTIAALCSYYYRGGPWELIARHAFRG